MFSVELLLQSKQLWIAQASNAASCKQLERQSSCTWPCSVGMCPGPSGRPPPYRSLLPYHTVALCAVRAGYLLYIIVGVQCCVVAACQAASGLRRHPTREAANSSARTAIKLYLSMLGRDVPRPVRATASIQVAAALPHRRTVRSARSVPAATPSSLCGTEGQGAKTENPAGHNQKSP